MNYGKAEREPSGYRVWIVAQSLSVYDILVISRMTMRMKAARKG